jgi:hypothetical protein
MSKEQRHSNPVVVAGSAGIYVLEVLGLLLITIATIVAGAQVNLEGAVDRFSAHAST